ncbi:unnamed protein product [Leptidea sinapis]|uniref:FANCI solenoid 1 domain-containing protein n=1 Tax=Leptidea sinapis TaxID=189913 RepID=A0A5E4R2A0_9NEOP|nr:unnamed protein product [Leptidea sinapis]
MDSKNLFSRLKELGHNSKRDELRDYCKQKYELILKNISNCILNSDASDLINYLFKGLIDNHSGTSKVKLIDKVLQTMRKESTSLTHCGDVVSRLCLELPRLPVEHLVRWSDDSVQSIIDDSDINMIWRDVLPECLNAISTYSSVKHCGTDMSGAEYKIQCVHTLCQCRWKERQLVQLTAMFKDMQLPRNEHKQVVNKICSYIVDIPPETLPPLVHQLLKLCKVHNMEIVLAHLSNYFNLHLYSKLEPPPQDSESTTMDIDDIVQHSHAELSRCLSTCLYHISQGAADQELIRRQIKQWPKTQLLRTPFLVDLALAVSDKGSEFRSLCLDVIRSAIEQRTLDELRSKESSWVRSVLPPDVNVASVLKVLTTESANHRQLTVLGLINLAFSLLSVPKTKAVAPTCWSHGKLILVRLCKSQPETAQHILGQLSDKLMGDATHRHTILESCQPAGDYVHAAQVYAAVRPLISFILKHMRLSGSSLSSSQGECSGQYSGHSITSRIKNETICLEKPALQETLLELFYDHLSKYEPIGYLLYGIAQHLQPSENESDDILSSQLDNSTGYLKTKLNCILDRVCDCET